MAVRARRHLAVLVRYDLRYGLASPRGLLFLVFFGLVWTWIFFKLAGGAAQSLGSAEAGLLISWFFDEGVQRLFSERPPSLSAYFVIAATLTPVFALLGAADQTATDLGSKHLRFLIPRVGRDELFLARALGAAIMVLGAQLLAGIAAAVISLVVHPGQAGATLLYSLQVTGSLMAYSLPFIAIMSLVAAALASVGLAMLVGIGGYLLLTLVLSFTVPSEGNARFIAYLLPGALKPHLLQPEVGPALAALAAGLVYVALFGVLGWRVFRKRDA